MNNYLVTVLVNIEANDKVTAALKVSNGMAASGLDYDVAKVETND